MGCPRKRAACKGCPTPTGPDRHRPSPQAGDRLISEVRMSSLDHARDAVDLVAAAVNAVVRAVEHSVFVEDLIDRAVFFVSGGMLSLPPGSRATPHRLIQN